MKFDDLKIGMLVWQGHNPCKDYVVYSLDKLDEMVGLRELDWDGKMIERVGCVWTKPDFLMKANILEGGVVYK